MRSKTIPFPFLLVLGTFLALALPNGTVAQQLYELDKIQRIDITFSQSNWDYMLDTAMAGSEGYIMAQAVAINGTQYDSVGVKYKGNSSYNANNRKNPWHIELDHYKSQHYQGYTDIKLSNIFRDPSHIREVLGYEIVNKYIAAPKANFARVYVNGAYVGLYTNVEHAGKKFVDKHFYGNDNAFFKCTPVGGAGPGNAARPTLQYLGRDSALYASAYEPENPVGWAPFIRMVDTLNNKPAAVATVLDVDRALWMHALNNTMVNLDSYLGTFAQNYYLYQDNNWRFNTIMWDLNMCFGSFTQSASGNLTATQMQQLAPTYGEAVTARPLINKLLTDARTKRMYMAHMRTLLAQEFTSGTYYARAQYMQQLIDSSVNADANKFYTYQQFRQGLTTTVGTGPMGGIVGVQQLMSARATYLAGQYASAQTAAPVLVASAIVPFAPQYADSVYITLSATNATYARLGYRDATWKKFTYTQMYDDGRHADGAAADGIYGVRIKMTATSMQYYFYAENSTAGTFLPANAEYVFYTLNAAAPTVNAGDVIINEFLAQNNADTTDAAGQHEDWIELHNTTTSPLSMAGLYLSDDRTQLQKSALDPNLTLPAGGHLFIFADGDTATGEVHAAFKLSAGGEAIYLSTSSGQVLDSVVFGAQVADVSQSRCVPGGIPGYVWLSTANTTPGYANACITTSLAAAKQALRLYPNPVPAGQRSVHISAPGTYMLYSLVGQHLASFSVQDEPIMLPAHLSPGTYLLRHEGMVMRLVVE